jgi:hypothetical protein
LVERLMPTSSRADARRAMTYVTVPAELMGGSFWEVQAKTNSVPQL